MAKSLGPRISPKSTSNVRNDEIKKLGSCLKEKMLFGLMMVPLFLGEYLKGIPFLFTYKKEKLNLIITMPKSRLVHQTLL